MKKYEKKIKKKLNLLLEYDDLLNTPLKPKGDGAKLECAKEVHREIKKIVNTIFKNKLDDVNYLLLEWIELSLLNRIDPDITIEELDLMD